MCDRLRNQELPAFDQNNHFESDEESGISAFGFPKFNHGWIECVSKRFPGQTYYFNVDTCCSTWSRPVSRFVPVRLARPLTLMSDEDFLDNAPIEVSDIEDENDYEEDDYEEEINPDLPPDADDLKPPRIIADNSKESRDSKMYTEVLFKLYHCYNYDWNNNENDDIAPLKCETLDDDSSENIAAILPETCYSSDSDSKSTNSDSRTLTAKTERSENSEDQESFDEVSKEEKCQPNEFDRLHDFRTSSLESDNDENSLNILPPSSEESDIGSRENGLSSDSDEEEDEEDDEDEENENTGNYNAGLFSLPRLKTIEYTDLAQPRKIKKRRKATKRKASNENDETSQINPRNKIVKIICEVNGITTVNYDYLPPELPTGVKISNLSDSESSRGYDAWHEQKKDSSGEATEAFGFLDYPVNFSDPDLSDSSSSSASSTKTKTSETNNNLRVTKDLKRKESDPSESTDSSSSSSSDSNSSSGSSVGTETIEARNNFSGVTKDLNTKKIEQRKSFSLSSSSESSWCCSSSCNGDDD